jgi:hypothetical protein
VHEAYLALVRQDVANLQNGALFMAISVQLTRRILLQYARRRWASKRAAPDPRCSDAAAGQQLSEEILAVDEAIQRLANLMRSGLASSRCGTSGGLSVEETAEAPGVSPRTVNRNSAERGSNDRSALGLHLRTVSRCQLPSDVDARPASTQTCGRDLTLRRNVQRLLALMPPKFCNATSSRPKQRPVRIAIGHFELNRDA